MWMFVRPDGDDGKGPPPQPPPRVILIPRTPLPEEEPENAGELPARFKPPPPGVQPPPPGSVSLIRQELPRVKLPPPSHRAPEGAHPARGQEPDTGASSSTLRPVVVPPRAARLDESSDEAGQQAFAMMMAETELQEF